MRKLGTPIAIVAVALVMGSWVHAAPKSDPPPQARADFVALSVPLLPGGLGRLEANALCQAVYSQSRVCNTRELADSFTLELAQVPLDGMWVFEKRGGFGSGLGAWSAEFGIPTNGYMLAMLPKGHLTNAKVFFDELYPEQSIERPFACCALVP